MKIEDYNEYYIQGTDHYLIPKDNFEELFNEMVNWKEESQNLKKQVKIKEDGFKASTEELCEYAEENQELKKQLEEWEQHLIIAKEMLDLQGQDGNYNYDSYMLGLYNGMEYIIAFFETREPNFRNGKDIDFLSNSPQQKELIEYLENEINELTLSWRDASYIPEEILSKYKEIIGGKE